MRFLSDEWFEALAAAVGRIGSTAELSVGQVIHDGPTTHCYRFVSHLGRVAVERLDATAGPIADVTFEETRDVAAAVGRGERSAGHAVLTGDIVVHGDVSTLAAEPELATALADAVGSLADRTAY